MDAAAQAGDGLLLGYVMRTRDRLASELRAVAAKAQPANAEQYEVLAKRAETGEFDDYADNEHLCPVTALYEELVRLGFLKFARRVASGEFDATREESEEWARSVTDPETLRIMEAMGIGPDRSTDY